MASLQATGHNYALPFRLLPLPSPCRHEQRSESAQGLPSFFPSLSSTSLSVYAPSASRVSCDTRTCGVNTNLAIAGCSDVAHCSKSTSRPYSDPEMYALRNMFADMENSGRFWNTSSSSNTTGDSAGTHHLHHHLNTTVTAKPQHPQVATHSRSSGMTTGGQSFYVEALVDTSAHIIESIWSSGFTKMAGAAADTTANLMRPSTVVPLRTFIQEVLKRSRTTYSTLQTALFYLFRARPAILSQLYKDTMMDWQDAYVNCGRRMFLASLVLASKFVQDKTYRNSAWGKIAGLPVAEINAAERIFLDLIKYRLYISHPTFEQWHYLLHMHVEARASRTNQEGSRKKRRISGNDAPFSATTTVDSTTSITMDLFHLHLHHNHHNRQQCFKKRKRAAETEEHALHQRQQWWAQEGTAKVTELTMPLAEDAPRQ
ncbi:hypothetical protein BX666DRAFT_2025790 [Dichotomocladium elegans]|nr:hypothetical protein BX666DRAFT_2025790 [Dichotomocladium elegans]